MRLPLIAITIVGLAPTGFAFAQAAPTTSPTAPVAPETRAAAPQDPDRAARARVEYQAAAEHFGAGRYLEAIHGFQVAASLVPSAALSYNIARCYEGLASTRQDPADYQQAIEYYQRYLRDQVDPPDRTEVETQIAALTELLEAARVARRTAPTDGTVLISGPPAVVATVYVDDQARGAIGDVDDLRLAGGAHVLRVEGPRVQRFVSQLQLQPGLSAHAEVQLYTHTTHTAIHNDPLFAWFAFGGAGAALIGAGVFGALALDRASQAGQAEMLGNGDLFAEPRTLASFSDGLAVATGGLVALGVVLYFAETNAVGTTTVDSELMARNPDGAAPLLATPTP